MADKKVQYVNVVYKADTQQFTTNVNKAKSSMEQLASSVNKVDKQSKEAKNSVGQIGDGANKSASGLDKLGISAGISASVMSSIINIAGQVVNAMVDLGKQAVSLASDYQENLSKTEAVFGSNADKFVKMANTITGATGLSKNAFLEQVSLYGAMAKAMGVSTEQTMEMSEQLTRLSADMSSFYNKDIEQVSTALKGVFTGETEALKEFGIVMTETNLQQFAKDIGVSYNELDQAGKVMLRYQYIMDQTKIVQGDYQRTSDGLANSTRTLKANFENLLTTIGTNFLSALEQPMNAINNAFKLATQSQADFDEQIKQAQTSTDQAKKALANLDQQLRDGTISQQEYQEEYKRLTDSISQNDAFIQQTQQLKDMQPGLQAFMQIIGDIAKLSFVISPIGQTFYFIQGAIKGFTDSMSWLTPVIGYLDDAFKRLNEALGGDGQSGLSWAFEQLKTIITNVGYAFGTVLGGAISFIVGLIAMIIDGIAQLISWFQWLGGEINNLWQQFINWGNGVINSVSQVWNYIISFINSIIGQFNGFIGTLWGLGGQIFNAIISGFQGIADWVYNNVIAPIVNFFSNLGSQISNGISSAIDTVKGWFGFSMPNNGYAFNTYQQYGSGAYGSRTLNTTYNYNIYTKADPTLDFISRQKAMVEGGQAYAFNRPRF